MRKRKYYLHLTNAFSADKNACRKGRRHRTTRSRRPDGEVHKINAIKNLSKHLVRKRLNLVYRKRSQ